MKRRVVQAGSRSRVRARSRPWAPLLALALALPLGASVAVSEVSADERVVAIGDIHGDLEAVTQILARIGLIDEHGNWAGGDSTLVQTGDFLDRGAEVRGVMDLLMRLQEQAPASGGRVVALLGNHEAMNLTGFYRDANPEAYSRFTGAGSQQRFEQSWESHWEWVRRAARRSGQELPDQGAERDRFFATYPTGFLEYQDALEPEGRYGRWLRALPMIAVVGDSLFLHGGLSEEYSDWPLERINEMAATEIGRYHRCRQILLRDGVVVATTEPSDLILQGRLDLQRRVDRFTRSPQSLRDRERDEMVFLRECLDYEKWLLVKEESPVWFRGYARGLSEEETEALVDEALARFGVARVVVGHTPQSDARIGSRFDGKALLIDTGMLRRVYQGEPVALVIDGNDAREVRLDGERDLPDGVVEADRLPTAGFPTPTVVFRDRDGEPLPFADEDDIVEFLRTARVVDREEIPTGVNRPTKLLLQLDSTRAHAVFRTVDEQRERWQLPTREVVPNFRDSFRYEPAAYRLSRLLGLDAVPPAVERRIEGKLGSIQLWVHGVMTEKQRVAEGIAPPRPLEWTRHRAMRKLFDNLVGNIDRNQGNILIEKDTWRVWLIDHTRAFITRQPLIDPEGITWCEREVYERLKSVDEDTIRVQLEGILDRFELQALLGRWTLVAEALDRAIAERGEEGVLFEWEDDGIEEGSP